MNTTLQKTEMEKIVAEFSDKLVPFKVNDIIEVEVLSISKNKIMVDVAGVALGIIPEKEYSYDSDDLHTGDKVLASVLLGENKDGYVILSLKRADRERVWTTLNEKLKSKEPIKLKITSANRGGLLVDFGGVDGFIPTSQLSDEHYPKISSGVSQHKIVGQLKDLIGTTILARVITIDKNNSKLIFSEKQLKDEKSDEAIASIPIGTRLKGKVTGVVDFGVFIKVTVPGLNKEMEGLVHISEVSWDRVENLTQLFHNNQEVDVEVISNKSGRLSFSIKKLIPDPWLKASAKYKEGDIIKGEVTRVTPFGAFVKIEDSLDGLVHISEMGDDIDDPNKIVKQGEKYDFKILSIEPNARKIALTLKLKIDKAKSKPDVKKAIDKKPALKEATKSPVKKIKKPIATKTVKKISKSK